jgi:hypothetical protein
VFKIVNAKSNKLTDNFGNFPLGAGQTGAYFVFSASGQCFDTRVSPKMLAGKEVVVEVCD